MTTFADGVGCTEITGSGAYFCEGACLRNVQVRVNGAFSIQNSEMVISNEDGEEDVATWKRTDWDSGESVYQNTIVTWEGFFGISLPMGSYVFSFREISTGEAVWSHRQ